MPFLTDPSPRSANMRVNRLSRTEIDPTSALRKVNPATPCSAQKGTGLHPSLLRKGCRIPTLKGGGVGGGGGGGGGGVWGGVFSKQQKRQAISAKERKEGEIFRNLSVYLRSGEEVPSRRGKRGFFSCHFCDKGRIHFEPKNKISSC